MPPLPSDRETALLLTPVSRETAERLDRFVALLAEWQAKTNLIASSELPKIWTRHVADSLQLLRLAPSAKRWLDFGSGGGFPGVVLACALEGLSQLLQTVEQVRSTLNPTLTIHGIVLTMFDARNNLSNQVVADVRQFMGKKVYETMIPRNIRISEAPSYGKPVLVYDLKCVGSEAYLKLATEVIQRERELRAH